MSDLYKIVSCLEKIKTKNLGQNPDNLKHFLMKDFDFNCEDSENLIEEALAANTIKSVIFNDKTAYRIVKKNSTADDTILAANTQEDDSSIEQNEETIIIRDTQLPAINKQNENESVQSSIDAIEKRFVKIEDHLIGLSNPVSVTSPNPGDQEQDYFYTNLLKNRISELEKQLADKNAIIDFLSLQIINKPPDTQVINRNNDRIKANDKSNHVFLPQENQNDNKSREQNDK